MQLVHFKHWQTSLYIIKCDDDDDDDDDNDDNNDDDDDWLAAWLNWNDLISMRINTFYH